MLNRRLTKGIYTTLFYIAIAGIAIVIALPMYFLFIISFMSDQEAYDWPITLTPSFKNRFIIQKADSGYEISVYSRSKGEFVPLFESDDLEELVEKVRLKTNSSIPLDLLKRKISELEKLLSENGEKIDELRSAMKPYEERIDRINGKISMTLSTMNKLLKKLDMAKSAGLADVAKSIESKIASLRENLEEYKRELSEIESKLDEYRKSLIPLSSVEFTVSKNLFENYLMFFRVTNDALPALVRSIEVALLTIAISLSIGGLAGYAFARYYFKGKNLLKLSVLFVRMFPGVSIAMPMVIILARMGFYDKPLGLSLVYSVGQIGMTTWITASIFMGIPVELEEAARIFGCSRWGAFFHVTLPLALPGLAASAMYAFIGSWSETAQAVILTQFNPTCPVVVYQTLVGAKGLVNLVAAGGVTMAVPAIVFTLIIRRYILQMWGGITI